MTKKLKVLFVAMQSIHFIRWIENLNNSDYELHFFDVLNRGEIQTHSNITQYSHWKRNKIRFKGKTVLKKNLPWIYDKLHPFLEVTADEFLESLINKINPNIIHSLEMQSCSYPIYKTMLKYPSIKWVYSCWGSDLFYYKNFAWHKKRITKILSRLDYLLTDCNRDLIIAKHLGFKGIHLGIIPGGSGYDFNTIKDHIVPFSTRRIILVKGYEHKFGKALNVIKALEKNLELHSKYEIVVFGAHEVVINYVVKHNLNFKVYGRHELNHQSVMELFGKARIYIGNSISDGLPNTLLEAFVTGAFPIQSNPGKVTEEIITDNVNGLIIRDPGNIEAISRLIEKALVNDYLLETASKLNQSFAETYLDKQKIKIKIGEIYNSLK